MLRSLTVKQHAYEDIREKLYQGDLKPGSRISDDQLARELGISRSPIREAISQLATEGLIELRPRTGVYVTEISQRELVELFESRATLEGFAARRAPKRVDEAGLVELRRLCAERRSMVEEYRALKGQTASHDLMQRFLTNDLAFHACLLTAAGNGRLAKVVNDCKILTRFFSFVPRRHTLRSRATSYRYHVRILRALERRDGRAAAKWMTRPMRLAKRLLIEEDPQAPTGENAAAAD